MLNAYVMDNTSRCYKPGLLIVIGMLFDPTRFDFHLVAPPLQYCDHLQQNNLTYCGEFTFCQQPSLLQTVMCCILPPGRSCEGGRKRQDVDNTQC